MGIVRLKLKEYIDSKGITRYQIAKDCEMGYPTVDRYYKNITKEYDSRKLAKFCEYLNCKIEDIIEYVE